jgi:DNA-damage-inducible protein D
VIKCDSRIKLAANQTHYDVGTIIRRTIAELGGTMPEDLPAAESIRKIQKKVEKEKLLESTPGEE